MTRTAGQLRTGAERQPPALAYLTATLAALCDTAIFIDRNGEKFHPDAFTVRAHGSAGLRCDIPRDDGENGVLERHLAALLTLSAPLAGADTLWRGRWRSISTPDAEFGEWAVAGGDDSDFTFQYDIVPCDMRAPSLAAYCATVTNALLDIVDLWRAGEPVMPYGLQAGNETAALPRTTPGRTQSIGSREEVRAARANGRQPLHSVVATEPLIVALARHWGAMFASIHLEPVGCRSAAESSVAADGFRLRDLRDWLIASDCHPSEVYEYLARVCNVGCTFCYLYGNPGSLAVARGRRSISADEIETRLRYFDPTEGRALFRAQWEINEFLIDPMMPSILAKLRERTTEPFYFITNGSPLTSYVVDLLSEVRPVTLIVSSNTLDAPLRRQLMHETRGQNETAMSCLQRLRERRIPFGVSVVATPDLNDQRLRDVVHGTEHLTPAFIRINLPGYTDQHPEVPEYDLHERWHHVTQLVRELRAETRTPLLLIPSAFEENFFERDPHAARLLGTVPGSPAWQADLRPGDVVTTVNGFEVACRSDLQALLMLLRGRVHLRYERAGQPRQTTFDTEHPYSYPFDNHVIGKYVFPHGVVIAPSLSPGDADAIRREISNIEAKRAWVITSPLMAPAARSFLDRHLDDLADRLHVVVVRNDYLGGNIRVLDMATVGDIAHAVEQNLTRMQPPDLILLPGTGFNRRGRDITGQHWSDLERHLDVPTRLLNVTTQFLY